MIPNPARKKKEKSVYGEYGAAVLRASDELGGLRDGHFSRPPEEVGPHRLFCYMK